MTRWWRSFLKFPWLVWPAVVLLAVLDAAGLYMLLRSEPSQATSAERPKVAAVPLAPIKPPPPAMIHPPAVETVLQSGTLIVISKKSQNMFVFSNGTLWASSPISTGKRRHETPSGVFPILQKRKHHRSNLYSNAPMPFMQRLTWTGIALHAGWVPGYPASHGCVRIPRAFAQALFKLTNASETTVVIGDDPLETEINAQQYALTARLPVHSALAPPADPPKLTAPAAVLASAAVSQSHKVLARAATLPIPPPPIAPLPTVAVAGVANQPQPAGGETIQLAAAASQAEAEAHWARLVNERPELSRYQKTVEHAVVNARRVYRLRISGVDAHSACLKLKGAGISCLNVS